MRFTPRNNTDALDGFWNDLSNSWQDSAGGSQQSGGDLPDASTTPATDAAAAATDVSPTTDAAVEIQAETASAAPVTEEDAVAVADPVVTTVSEAADLSTAPAAQSTAASSAALTRYDGTIHANSGDVIENLDIYSDGVGIELEDDDNVTIRNVRIHYNAGDQGSAGIDAVGADGLAIQGVELINAGAPASGPNSDGGEFGVSLFQSPGASVTGATVRDASTGIYLQDSPNAALEGIEGYNMRGPFPRGQLVQFNRSGNSSLNNFYVFNDLQKSWTEDNIHVGHDSDGIRITNGLIDGNNSPSGVGVMLEGAQNTTVRNVDTVRMGNGAFTDLGSNNLFDDVRSFDNFFASQAGRGTPLSGSLIFGLADDTTLINGAYQNPAQPENVVYGGGIQDDAFGGTYQATEISGQTPMAAWHNTFSWS